MVIRLKTQHHTIPAFRFIVEYTIKHAPVSGVVSRIYEAMVAELTVQSAANVVELFVKIFVLYTTPFLHSGLVT